MTRDITIQKALKHVRNRYLLVHLLTQRIRQLKEGTQPLVPKQEGASFEEIALQEIAEQKLSYELPYKTSTGNS
jgi:DNA-directed RNA polymerase subunit omega